jgi:hypothetical protein
MMTTCVIHQPEFLPWLGFFSRLARCDVFVVLDHIQFMVRGFQNRNKIRTRDGWMWLTVPVRSPHGKRILDVEIDNSKPWKRRHLKAIQTYYGRTPFYEEYVPSLRALYGEPWKKWYKLCRLNLCFIIFILKELGLQPKLVMSSTLRCEGTKSDLILDICKKVGADTYLSGVGAKNYMDTEKFERAGIEVKYQDFTHPTYKQRYEPFVPNLSVIDALLCIGSKGVKELIS